MVIGNKSDLAETSRVISTEKAQQVVKQMGDDIDHLETSARDNHNVAEAFT